jgi:predicted ATPase
VTRGLYAEALAASGRFAEALVQVDEGLVWGATTGESSYDSWLHRVRGGILLHLHGAADPAPTAAFRDGLAIARAQEAKGFELLVALALARLEAEQGRRGAARELLAPLCAWFTEGLDAADLRAAKALLDELA